LIELLSEIFEVLPVSLYNRAWFDTSFYKFFNSLYTLVPSFFRSVLLQSQPLGTLRSWRLRGFVLDQMFFWRVLIGPPCGRIKVRVYHSLLIIFLNVLIGLVHEDLSRKEALVNFLSGLFVCVVVNKDRFGSLKIMILGKLVLPRLRNLGVNSVFIVVARYAL